MKKALLRIFSLLLLVVFVYTTTVKEIHFLFLNHSEVHDEHCSNHLHDYSHHDSCSFCKIDLPFSIEAVYGEYHNTLPFADCKDNVELIRFFFTQIFEEYFLRGPPTLC